MLGLSLGRRDVALPKLKLVEELLSSNGVVTKALNPLITNVNDILGPTSDLLGLTIGGADLFGVPTPQCAFPALVG